MSEAESPAASVRDVLGDDAEITRLNHGDVAFSCVSNGTQTLFSIAADEWRAAIVVEDDDPTDAEYIEAAHGVAAALNRIGRTSFGGGELHG